MPNYYAQIEQDGRVFALSELAGEVTASDMIPINEELYQNNRLLYTRYVDGEFKGLFAQMESDKSVIKPDGEEMLTVTITMTDLLGKVQSEFNEELDIELNGMKQTVKPTKGVAEITISSDEPGDFLMKTIGLDRNAELKVVVSDGN
ncbi:hypothetical protein SAMN04488542_10454 [Fontibacillus panacisegetis]|uniref:Ig-like domain (Group 3) n=1 Tax=Fontibacillus panacisegetis TaxID=670482 RepID=A0A1G7H9H8_9BACL|nr:hypothetical protein [Fontibacillus panacisegetis]SDE96769.1 hypothetical protein SAMN04488542_10454 [Fontibacillus panacisegetis]